MSRSGVHLTPRRKYRGRLLNINLGDDFSDLISKVKATKAKTNWWDDIKLKSFSTAEGTINTMKREPKEWENICANHTSDIDIFKIYKE